MYNNCNTTNTTTTTTATTTTQTNVGIMGHIDNNTTTIVLVPSDFTTAARSFTELVAKKKLEE